MHSALESLLAALARLGQLAPDERAASLLAARQADLPDLQACGQALAALPRDDFCERTPEAALLATFLSRLSDRLQELARHAPLDRATLAEVESAYRRLGTASLTRHGLLHALAASGQAPALALFADSICNDPPARAAEGTLAFVPLFRRVDYPIEPLFPRLLDGLGSPSTAAAILDLASFLLRQGRLSRPALLDRVQGLGQLLGAAASRLQRIEERPAEYATSAPALTAMVGEAVTLVVSLCGVLAEIGDDAIAGKLQRALQLSHRRVRTEAAAALARLGDDTGLVELVALCAEPVVRLRALEYLRELGREDRAAAEHRSPAAIAEAEFAAWLALPTRFGLPPGSIELVDSRTLPWPGYSQPVACYLFRYEYRASEKSISGIGLAGPATHAFAADLSDLPPADIYAAYAGFDASHADITETPADELSADDRSTWARVAALLDKAGYARVNLVKASRFFGETHFVATAEREGRPGVAVYDGAACDWHADSPGARPLGPTEVYCLHKGRKLLRAFEQR